MSPTTEYPDYFARFYDLIYSQIRTGVDKDFFINRVLETNGQVLEVGVGTGRFFIDALEKGADIYGVDISESMVNVLKNKLDKKHHNRICVMDATNLKLDRKFDLVIAPFRVFAHVLEMEQQLQVLNTIYDHLKPGGQLIFDLYVPNLQMLIDGAEEQTDFEGEYEPGKKIKRIVWAKNDLITQLNHVTMKFVWDENSEEITKEWKFILRFYFRYEIEHLIHRSKLTLDKILGDYSGSLLNSESKDFIVCAHRS